MHNLFFANWLMSDFLGYAACCTLLEARAADCLTNNRLHVRHVSASRRWSAGRTICSLSAIRVRPESCRKPK